MAFHGQNQGGPRYRTDKEAKKRLENHPQVKLASFNLMNLASPEKDYYPRQRYSRSLYEEKIAWTANQLNRMDADLVGFQEVFDRSALEAAIKASLVYSECTLEIADECGYLPRVALLSRYPIISTQVISEFPALLFQDLGPLCPKDAKFSRPVLKARVQLPNQCPVTVLVCHLKSKRPMIGEDRDIHDPWEVCAGTVRSLVQRACEAAALRHLILEEIQDKANPLILLGDLNDAPHAVTSDILQGLQPQKRYPPDVKAKLWDILLYSCQDLQIRRSYKDVYYTHLHNSHYESLDHILVSQEFVNENPRHIAWVEYMRLYNDHLLDPSLAEEDLPRQVSDHAQVLVSIRMR
jgi:endonuclease/exonuclease/phosphatase family metal-dependent hydrolase